VKLLYCPHCHDIVRLFPEKRTCRCGKSWGQYLEDRSTTVQTWPSLSLGIANPDFVAAEQAFGSAPKAFSPALTMRSWINPISEPDVTFVRGHMLETGEVKGAADLDANEAAPVAS
jgi:hypothetical protein